MPKSDPYSRIYWRFIDEFNGVYEDDHAMATWLRLLLVADGTWPAYPPVPRWATDEALKVLTDAELVTLLPGGRYSMRGLDAERERRSEQGMVGARARWSDRNADALPTHSGRNAAPFGGAMRDETRQEEKRRAIRAQARVDSGEFLTFAQALEAVRAEK